MPSYTPDAKLFQDLWSLPDNPFPFLGADQYPEEQILSLFEIDRDTTLRAFSLQNSIIEGSYGTGKTMLLKAIYSFHYSKMIVDIAENKSAEVIPIYIRFSDLSYGSNDFYRDLILHIYKKILDTRFLIHAFINDDKWFPKFKNWLNRLTNSGVFSEDKRYSELSADSVTKRISKIFKTEGEVGFNWLQKLGVAYEKDYETELIKKPKPGILDVENLFLMHFKDICNKILLLIDEVDTLPQNAFEKDKTNTLSIYEVIFNQLRTNKHFLYKIAVYPNTASSSQVEGSRIGTRVKLGFNIKDEKEFSLARDFFYRILKSYLSFCAEKEIEAKNYFLMQYVNEPEKYPKRVFKVDDQKYGDALEQLVFGSKGIVRRFIKLSGDSMLIALRKERENLIVTKYDVFDAMRDFGKELIERLTENSRALMDRIAFYTIQNKVFRFRAIGDEEFLLSIYDNFKQDNVMYPILDQDRKGTNYFFEFDYCYCLYRNIPTHYFLNAEKVSLSRSLVNGKWITKAAKVPRHILNIEAKIEGTVKNYNRKEGWGFINYLPTKDLFFHKVNIVTYNEKGIVPGCSVSFRIGSNYKGECAVDIELL